MPGMNSGPGPGSPILVSAFRSALLQQWLIVALIFILLLIAWGATRTAIYGSVAGAPPAGRWREPRARLLLRVGFGSIWLFDGILQAQPQMAGGLADQVIQPSASSSPAWVQHLVNFGVTAWDYHPVQAASASVWIQVGIGLWMLIAVRGWSARLAGVAGVAWGLVVWAFGEAFGGIFAPGLTFLFGAPGAVLIYVVAGVLLALPERAWDNPRRLGRLLLGGAGAFLLGMALLQAWPGRGFWQGTLDGQPGSLAAMIKSMAGTSQPHAPEAIVSGFGNFTAAHGFAVNLVAVLALAVVGAGLFIAAVRGDLRLARIAVIAGAVFCLADWVLVEDLGFFGGLGTDPNSMIPFILLFTAGYLGLAPAPARAAATASGVPEVGSAGLSAGIQGAGPITETASASGIPGTEDTGPITEISGISGAPAPDIPARPGAAWPEGACPGLASPGRSGSGRSGSGRSGSGRSGSARPATRRTRAALRSSTPWPVTALTGTTSTVPRLVRAISARARRVAGSGSARSQRVMTRRPWRTPRAFTAARCSADCGIQPPSAATTNMTAGTGPRPASMFGTKRSWPGTSTNASFSPAGSVIQA
jgi:hypothetical protein